MRIFTCGQMFNTDQVSVCSEKMVVGVKLHNSCQSVHGKKEPLLLVLILPENKEYLTCIFVKKMCIATIATLVTFN